MVNKWLILQIKVYIGAIYIVESNILNSMVNFYNLTDEKHLIG